MAFVEGDDVDGPTLDAACGFDGLAGLTGLGDDFLGHENSHTGSVETERDAAMDRNARRCQIVLAMGFAKLIDSD